MSQQLQFHLPMEASGISSNVFRLKEKLIEVIAETLDRYKTDGLALPEKDAFLAAAQAAFKKYIVAIDIPYIGPIVEKAVDDAILAAFMKLVEAMYDRFVSA